MRHKHPAFCALGLALACVGAVAQAQDGTYQLPEAIDAMTTGDRDFLRADLDLYPLRLNYVFHFAHGLNQRCEGFERTEARDFKEAIDLMRDMIRPRLEKKEQVHLALGRIFAEDDLAHLTAHYDCRSREIRLFEEGIRGILYDEAHTQQP